VGKYIVRAPALLCLKKETLDAKIDWFRNCVGADVKWLRMYLFQGTPRLLNANIQSLEKKRHWLMDRLELDEVQITRITRYHPAFLSRSIDNSLDPSVQWIEKRFNLRDKSAVGDMICKHPALIAYNVKNNLEPKIVFFTKVLGGDESKALAIFTHDPTFLSYSLEKRIRPRWNSVKSLDFPRCQHCVHCASPQVINGTSIWKGKWNNKSGKRALTIPRVERTWVLNANIPPITNSVKHPGVVSSMYGISKKRVKVIRSAAANGRDWSGRSRHDTLKSQSTS